MTSVIEDSDQTKDESPRECTNATTTIKPARSVEGWTIFCANLHEECTEEDVRDLFADYGALKNLHLVLDKATLLVKGYAVVEFVREADARRAIAELHGKPVLREEVVS